MYCFIGLFFGMPLYSILWEIHQTSPDFPKTTLEIVCHFIEEEKSLKAPK